MALGQPRRTMLLNFDDAIRVGEPSDLIEIQRSTRGAPTVASSKSPRGLSMKSLYVTQNRRGPWSLLGRRKQIYFLSVAFDLSDRGPVVFPPAQVPADAIYRVHPGQAIQFTLGDGAPIFPPRTISGGLVMYITVCDADKGTRHVGEVLAQVHQDLNKDGSLTKVITGFIKSPSKVVIDEVL